MLKVIIEEEFYTAEEVLDGLNIIATQVKKGYTSGHFPTWRMEGEATKESNGD